MIATKQRRIATLVSAMPSRPAVSVILVREHAEQMTGSGCCGKLEGDSAALGGEDLFQLARQHQRDMGVLHRAVRQFFARDGDDQQVAIVTVDPRNQLYLVPKLIRDVWHFRPGLRSGLACILQMFSLPAVIVNGRVVSRRGQPPTPDDLCHLIAEQRDRR